METLLTHTTSVVKALDKRDPEAGGASHRYSIRTADGTGGTDIRFQHGGRNVEGSIPGALDDDLLAIEQDRMECFQAGPFACEENAQALRHIKRAREALARRAAKRVAKGVLGYNEKH